jgi:protein-tyrosine phosphatase
MTSSNLYWIEHAGGLPRVAIMARPRAGDWLPDEISALRDAGVGTVVSLLEPEEIRELGLETEPDLCRQNRIDFVSFPIADRGVPDDVRELSRLCHSLLAADEAVAIHCRAGIGRSALVAAFMLTLAGMDADGAFAAIAEARGLAVPDTKAQLDWVRNQAGSTDRS